MNELGKDEKNFHLSRSQVNWIFFKKSTLFFSSDLKHRILKE
jgi:hypothetical protein